MKLAPHIDDAVGDVLACRCGCGLGNNADDWHPLLFDLFEAVREKCGMALAIISGCRCERHNAEVGGTQHSQHLVGAAFDVAIPGGFTPEDYFTIWEEVTRYVTLDQGGVGRYPPKGVRRAGWVHGDIGWRARPHRRWTR